MGKSILEENLETRADFFQALGHPARLLILNLVQMRPRHGQELAAVLNLTPATISHHLGKLTSVGLLEAQKDQYYQTYSLVGDLLEKPLREIVHLPQAELSSNVQEDAYRQKVLRTFFRHGRLLRIPAQRKKRQVILEKIVQRFEPEREYSHQEVNQILVEFHEDVATLRRELVANRLMERDNGTYRRILPPPA